MDLQEYRVSEAERERTNDIVRLIPADGTTALDVGARDGHFSKLLAKSYTNVTALDLEKPCIDAPNVTCTAGDVTNLVFDNSVFDVVLCAEVLEHINPEHLATACSELSRVTKSYLLIGVPYMQDTRIGRTTCLSCGRHNPPWGHVNTFSEDSLIALFPDLQPESVSLVGQTTAHTNTLSTLLMDLAANPYGTYDQEELCIYCDSKLIPPRTRGPARRLAAKLGFIARRATAPFAKPHAKWIHVLFSKSHQSEA